MTETFTTALYLFSSLLQADAAILGFGAIFVVYKLQALEGRVGLLVEIYHSKGTSYTSLVNDLVCASADEEKAKVLRAFSSGSREYKMMEELVTVPLRIVQVKSGVWIPLLAVGLHAIVSTILLSIVPALTTADAIPYYHWVVVIIIVWFSLGVAVSGWTALNLLAKRDELSLERLNNSLYLLVHDSKHNS